MIVHSEVIQDTLYSEEVEYTNFDVVPRITQQEEPRSIDDDKLRILQ